MGRDNPSYRKAAEKYDEYVEIVASKPERERLHELPPQEPYTPYHQDDEMSRTIFAAIGIGTGLLLLLLAGISFYTAAKWAGVARDGAAVGYTVVGFFLVLAGLGGIIATWNHNFRVLTRPPAKH